MNINWATNFWTLETEHIYNEFDRADSFFGNVKYTSWIIYSKCFAKFIYSYTYIYIIKHNKTPS